MTTRSGRRRRGVEAEPIHTPRLDLEPLRADDAHEMAAVLSDPGLYRHIGGDPPGEDRLRARYETLLEGSDEPGVSWCNWTMRRSDDGRAVGTVQATVGPDLGGPRAVIAWMVGAPWQRRGYAAEAATALIGWLHTRGVQTITAHIDPRNEPSAAVARRVGLTPTDTEYHGETVWTDRPAPRR
ncbi:GNAT family N-acetyltransferase [Actinorugispora endophytica]|uniref:RimJ/RimL family protein N-acetyltransferase n=1 Tax=Actinorugispora endophytica TaxID=1605990 RepID=A0A4R6ULR6_9ACTN|nr:GNAT family N-acetyltransferase [Actinorugispora endophytica]TDQ44184.1 RimJ/RimL family protein N-acetyltransferase [Actinorugispora endophytica]